MKSTTLWATERAHEDNHRDWKEVYNHLVRDFATYVCRCENRGMSLALHMQSNINYEMSSFYHIDDVSVEIKGRGDYDNAKTSLSVIGADRKVESFIADVLPTITRIPLKIRMPVGELEEVVA